MAVDVSYAGHLARAELLQARNVGAAHQLISASKGGAKQFHRDLRSYLIKASDQRLIDEAPHDVRRLLTFSDLGGGFFDVSVGGVRNFKRNPDLPHFTRYSDRAWFDFQMLIQEQGGRATILAYDFEIRLLSAPISFLRFDLNPPGHDNESDALRAHLHLSSDDDGMSVPSPILSPFEVLDILLHRVRQVGRVRRLDKGGQLVEVAEGPD